MKQDIYEQVTNRIITQLEQGVVPWKSPYFSEVGFPQNFATGNRYRGINVFLLASLRYTSPYFLTYIQAKTLSGNVRKGEHGAFVIKYGTYTKKTEGAAIAKEFDEHQKYLKAYTVFHASQIEGISFPEPESPALPTTPACDRARAMVAGMPKAPAITEGSAIPCYRPKTDCVHMPERRFFTSEEAYFSTLFHELTHSTGHSSRLARKSLLENKGMDAVDNEARKTYAEEELVAEMGASFLNAHAGIIETEIENSAAYLQGWINALKSHDAKGWIIRAAGQAQKAADFILNVPPQE